jgi:4-carboxymuconolactone decarboxylase
VVASRGTLLRPFQVLAHSPEIARLTSDLGALIRIGSSLSDHDRELVIMATASAHRCGFEWDAHLPLAQAAGVRSEVTGHLESGTPTTLTKIETLLIGFVAELLAASTVTEERFAAARAHPAEAGAVELCATIGYYTMLALVMCVCDAC